MTYSIEFESGIRLLANLRRNPHQHVAQMGRRSVNIRCLRVGSHRIFLVNHPGLIRNLLVTHDWNFIKDPGLRASRPVPGNGLLISEGKLYRRQRRLRLIPGQRIGLGSQITLCPRRSILTYLEARTVEMPGRAVLADALHGS